MRCLLLLELLENQVAHGLTLQEPKQAKQGTRFDKSTLARATWSSRYRRSSSSSCGEPTSTSVMCTTKATPVQSDLTSAPGFQAQPVF